MPVRKNPFKKHHLKFAVVGTLAFVMASCGGVDKNERELSEEALKRRGLNENFPMSNEDRRAVGRGSLLGEAGGFSLFGGSGNKPSSNNYSDVTGGVNAYLWRASLDTVSFMPLASADAIGGIIITDWFESADAKGERLKANIRITTKELRASGVDASLFRQELKNGNWRDVEAKEELGIKLENKILSRAREIKIEETRL